mmetsp:Transcript_10111/g.25328  ORF Transcript_10111/g.25328 Transcript_10111/m.25328 type:complete len:358 (+) Transcript_10111:1375-2448(+)
MPDECLSSARSYSAASASTPCLVKMSNRPRSPASLSPRAALRSPFVMAPNCFILWLMAATNRLSPPTSVTRTLKFGADSWFERCTRPSCCTAFSADHGSSNISITRCLGARLLPLLPSVSISRRSACKDIPAEAASVMIAIRLVPSWKARRSCSLIRFALPPPRCTYSKCPASFCCSRFDRPLNSATCSGPPSALMSSSSGFPGNRNSRTFLWAASRSSERSRTKVIKPIPGKPGAVPNSCFRKASSISRGVQRHSSVSTVLSCSASSPSPCASTSFIAAEICASPVPHNEMTTFLSFVRAVRASSIVAGTFRAMRSVLKKRCASPRSMPTRDFRHSISARSSSFSASQWKKSAAAS